jgi:hypothetical protein
MYQVDRSVFRYTIIVIVTLGVILVETGVFIPGWWYQHQLAIHGRQIPGIITARPPSSHSEAVYKFNYRGKAYESSDWLVHGVEIGNHVTGTFDPRNPDHSVIGDPISDSYSYFTAAIRTVMIAIIYCILVLRKLDRLYYSKA